MAVVANYRYCCHGYRHPLINVRASLFSWDCSYQYLIQFNSKATKW